MNFKRIGNKRDEMLATVMGADSTVIGGTPSYIPAGVPLILQYPSSATAGPGVGSPGGSDSAGVKLYPADGLGVVLPSSAPGGAAQAQSCFYGVNTQNLSWLQQGYSMVQGYYSSAIVRLATRAASTDTWSATTLANWALLTVDTVNNCFAVSATTSNGQNQAVAVLLGAVTQTGTATTATVTTNTNTFAGSATTTADTRTVITTQARIQIRAL